MLLEGIFPAITTPFYPDGRLYLRKLEHNVDRYSHTPIAGLVVLGSTGEAVMLGDEESREVLRIAREAAAPAKVLLAGVARESVSETLRLAEFAAVQQYDAVLVRTPNFYRMADLEMLTYYRTVADHSALPVVLYSIHKFTHYELPVDLVSELAHHPNIIGIKDSTGNVARLVEIVSATRESRKRTVTVTPTFTAVTARMRAEPGRGDAATFVPASLLGTDAAAVAIAPPRPALRTRTKEVGFQILGGSAEQLNTALEAGCTGAVLAFAACAPQVCLEIYTAWKENDPKLAEEKQQRIVAASAFVAGTLGVPGIKYACDLNGFYGGHARLPLLPLTAEQQREVSLALSDVRH